MASLPPLLKPYHGILLFVSWAYLFTPRQVDLDIRQVKATALADPS